MPKSFIQISPTLIFLFLFFYEKRFQEKGMHGYCGGCGGGVLRSDFTKNQDIRYKKINKIKIKIIPTDRPFAKFAI